LAQITLDVHLYGSLARHVNSDTPGCANLNFAIQEGSTIGDLLAELKLPTEERGITFINGNLSALPGLQPDLGHRLQDGDRVAFFDLKSMWPFQYRQGAQMIEELNRELMADEGKGLHHHYGKSPQADTGPA
jgi:hypothetical protein